LQKCALNPEYADFVSIPVSVFLSPNGASVVRVIYRTKKGDACGQMVGAEPDMLEPPLGSDWRYFR
jgi:hypothetical protein